MNHTTYQLGALMADGRQYHYTELPATRSLAAALEQQRARPHHATCDVVFKQTPARAHGIVYGLAVDILSARDGAMLVPWR